MSQAKQEWKTCPIRQTGENLRRSRPARIPPADPIHGKEGQGEGCSRPRRDGCGQGLHGSFLASARQPLQAGADTDEHDVGLLLALAGVDDEDGRHAENPDRRPDKGDKRFKDEDWEQHFLFDYI